MSKVTAKLADGKRVVEVDYEFGANLQAQRTLFGDEVIFNRAHAALVIDLQALIRRMIKADKKDPEIKDAVAKWKPDVKSVIRKSAAEKVTDLFGQLTPEQKKALLAQLKAA